MQTREVFQQGETVHPQTKQNQGYHTISLNLPRKTVIGSILLIALVSFEIFNFDTTRYALQNFLGDVRFLGVSWAAILAIAFCAMDFAGLARLFTPQKGREEPKAVWYLTGAWLLGATMNAVMTWWAISLTLINHQVGNEILSHQQLLQIVPIFVAALVWLTRILFIGAFAVAGEHIFDLAGTAQQRQTNDVEQKRPILTTQPAAQPQQIPQPSPKPAQPRGQQRPPIPSTPPPASPAPMRASPRQP